MDISLFLILVFGTLLCLVIVTGEEFTTDRRNISVKAVEELAGFGYSETPVMCKTVSYETVDNNRTEGGGNNSLSVEEGIWDSCGQHCMDSNALNQIKVDIRDCGNNILFEGCTGVRHTKICSGYHLKKLKCSEGECDKLDGIFNCTRIEKRNIIASCQNYTELISCNMSAVSLDKPLNLTTEFRNGLYVCKYGSCATLLRPSECKRLCSGIQIKEKNIFIMNGDSVSTVNCKKAVNAQTALELWPKDSAKEGKVENLPIFIIFCTSVESENGSVSNNYVGRDCFNGYFLNADYFNKSEVIDLQQLTEGYFTCGAISKNVPLEKDLLISGKVPLIGIVDFCKSEILGNYSTAGECNWMRLEFGQTGENLKLQSRFPCSRKKLNSTEYVVM